MRWAAGAHIVLGMNLEESMLQSVRKNRGEMFMLETGSGGALSAARRVMGTARLANRRCAGGIVHGRSHSSCRLPDQDFSGVSEPWPPPGTSILVQVPP